MALRIDCVDAIVSSLAIVLRMHLMHGSRAENGIIKRANRQPLEAFFPLHDDDDDDYDGGEEKKMKRKKDGLDEKIERQEVQKGGIDS